MPSSLSNWTAYGDYVQGGMTDGRFMSAAYTLIAAGPPRITNFGGEAFLAGALSTGQGADQIAYPMGIVQNFSLGHNMSLSRFFELGSDRSYFIPGRVVGQVSLSRVMYHGPSLLRVLYAYYQDLLNPTVVPAVFPNAALTGSGVINNQHDVKIPPGFENVFLNLASDLFTQPIGLLALFKDNNEDTMAAGYFESSYVPNHNIGLDAGGVVIQESVGVQFERMIPIQTNVVGLITGIE